MLRRRRNIKLKKPSRFMDTTRRRIARKMGAKRLLSRRIKQTPMRLEETENNEPS